MPDSSPAVQRKGRRASSSVVHPSRIKQLGRATPRALSPQAKHTLTFLFAHAHDDGTDIWCSVETLMDYTGFNRRSQFRALKELIDAEYLIEDGWKDYGHGLRTRRRRLDLARMLADREAEDLVPGHSAGSGTVGLNGHSAGSGTVGLVSRSATSGTMGGAAAVPDMAGHSARYGIAAVPDLAPKGTQEDSLKEPIDARAREGANGAGAISAFDALFVGPAATPSPETSAPASPPRRNYMPSLGDPDSRWAGLATGSEIDGNSMKGERKHCRAGWYIRDVALDVARAAGWWSETMRPDWTPLLAWLDEGICARAIIIPTIQRMVERNAGRAEIGSLMYFDRAIRESATGRRRSA